jgi:hypothetical protein
MKFERSSRGNHGNLAVLYLEGDEMGWRSGKNN